MANNRDITTADILPWEEYARTRVDHRRRISASKRNRRVAVGPYVNFYFENFDTMWLQVQEMLHIERGGAEQIAGELEAYNPLIPKGRELVATFMIEIPDPTRRASILAGLGGIEETAFLEIEGERIAGAAERDQDRTSAEGKASSVQFVHFHLSEAQIEKFRKAGAAIVVGLAHPGYRHMAGMPEEVRAELAGDFA
ncbi:MAG TPA: DUF3501 family protein [Methylocystis sp.]|nr:DUF3501 family protein [Methylocystis sp.]